MKCLIRAAALAGLLAHAACAHAISFSPPRTVSLAPVAEESARPPVGLTLGLAASSWGMPSQTLADATRGTLGTITFDSQVRPLITAEYRINDRVSVGGWYNFISWDVAFNPAPAYAGVLSGSANADGGIFEIHGTYDFNDIGPFAVSAQLGYQRMQLHETGTVQVVGAAPMPIDEDLHSDRLVAWGLGTYKVPLKSGSETGVGILGGLGLAQGLNDNSGPLEFHGLLGVSVAFTPAISADASAWFTDFARSDSFKTRVTAGVTGRF